MPQWWNFTWPKWINMVPPACSHDRARESLVAPAKFCKTSCFWHDPPHPTRALCIGNTKHTYDSYMIFCFHSTLRDIDCVRWGLPIRKDDGAPIQPSILGNVVSSTCVLNLRCEGTCFTTSRPSSLPFWCKNRGNGFGVEMKFPQPMSKPWQGHAHISIKKSWYI